ncbi:hypothetical protein FBEOM_9694 [Fusarium beomiforme]|uniref:Uncharacterized protein n=1 Tax=Fusarium beomiforme TaxID=44412 RepID=A0A9P5ACX7_9HYPO|nr:hypothetical protein FBEOM_9694 [Fusarium beomiforme]
MTNSYLPFSLSQLVSSPIRRDEKPPSESDQAVTLGIAIGIALTFVIPLLWYFIAKIVRARRARARDEEHGFEMQTPHGQGQTQTQRQRSETGPK